MTTGGSGSTAPASPESGESTSPAPALQLDETARFNVPYDFGSDSAGNLYVHDRQNNAIRKIAPDGKVSTVLTGLSGVYAATFDAHGNIYLLNSDSIIKVTPDGTRSALVTGYNDLTKGPVSMTVDSNETLYVNGHVTDANGNADIGTIWKITSSGNVSTIPVDGLTAGSDGIAIDSTGNLYVGNGSGALLKVTPSGVTTTITTAPYHYIGVNDIKTDSAGNIYFSAYDKDVSSSDLCYNHGVCGLFIRHSIIMKVATNGNVSTLLSDPPGSDEYSDYKYGTPHIAVRPDGSLYVAYASNHAIYRIDSGTASLVAGKPGEAGFSD